VESFHNYLETIMRVGRDPLVTQALPRLTIDPRRARSVAIPRDRRIYRRMAAWLIALPFILFAAMHAAWNRADPSHHNEIRGGVNGFVKVAAADGNDLLDDAQREDTSGMAKSPHTAPVYSRIRSEDSDTLDDAQREDMRGVQNTPRSVPDRKLVPASRSISRV
jgi:hypothetical protein